MRALQTLHWEHPDVLWALLLLPLLGLLLGYAGWQKRRLLRRWSLVPGVRRRSSLPSIWQEAANLALLLGGFALAVAGFASPTLSSVAWEPAWERVAMGLLLDVSPSMRAPARPHDPDSESRLDLLKQAVQELLEHLPGGVRVGIIAFAGVAVPVVPEPSADHQAVMAKVRRLDTTFIANPGTNLPAALRQGLSLFVDAALEDQPDTVSLVLLSDGDTPLTAAVRQVLRQTPLPVFTLGIGAPQPVPIPDPHSPRGVMTDVRGAPLTTAVNDALLRTLAEHTGGRHAAFTHRAELVQALQQLIAQQGQTVARPVPRPRPLRQACFLLAFALTFLYQFRSRPGAWRRQPGSKARGLV